jgi:hypothetical protein
MNRIFKNIFLINIKDGSINQNFFSKTYYFKKFFIFFFFSFCLISLNYILCSFISKKESLEEEEGKNLLLEKENTFDEGKETNLITL